MGFGLLFFGYFFFFTIPFRGIDVAVDLVGYAIMFIALSKISHHAPVFKKVKCCVYPLFLCGALILASQIGTALGFSLTAFTKITGALNAASILLFHLVLLSSTKTLALEVGVKKIAARSIRNIIITVLYYTLICLVNIGSPVNNSFLSSLSAVIYLFGYLFLILNLIGIYSCYMYICLEGDEDITTLPVKEKTKK